MTREASHHKREAQKSATPVRWLARPIAITFCAGLALGCHAQQKFPAAALAGPAGPELKLFEPTPNRLDDTHTFTDLSAMNAEPAGVHGFVRAALGHFVDDRGSRLRFFGVNLTGVAGLPEAADATRLARHFRKLGFNAVRLHALDSAAALLGNDGQLDPAALERLDFFCAELKTQGLYFSFGLHAAAGYAGLDGEARGRFPRGQVLDRFHGPFLDAQRAFARALLGHQNPHTQHRYVDEPALLYVELNHEDTLFPSRAGSPDDAPASYRAELGQGYAAWLAERTAEGLRAPGPADEEAKGELPTFSGSPNARDDYAQYLSFIERGQVKRLIQFIRSDLNLRSMLVNTQASFGGLAGVLREAELSDFIDVQGYWDAPPSDSVSPNGSIQNRAQVNAADGGTLGAMASYHVLGKPFVVSAYATPAPNDYAAETFPLLIGIAGLQDWDALFAYTYADHKRDYEPSQINGVFDLAGHPAKFAFLTSAASAFRRGLVAPGRAPLELRVPEQPVPLPFAENALPSLWSASGVPGSAAVLKQMGISLRPGSGPITASDTVRVVGPLGSDTGELLWDAQGPHARFSIDAPALKSVCGQIANSQIRFSGISFEFHDFATGFACASLIALDEQPIASARRLLLTVVGRAENAHRPEAAHSGLGTGPALAQYIPLTVTLPRAAWRVEALDTTGSAVHAVAIENGATSKLSTTFRGAALSYAITR